MWALEISQKLVQIQLQVVPQLFLILILLPGISGLAETTKSHNIIFILADDLGYGELGILGQNLIETPNIDSLARNGMLKNLKCLMLQLLLKLQNCRNSILQKITTKIITAITQKPVIAPM